MLTRTVKKLEAELTALQPPEPVEAPKAKAKAAPKRKFDSPAILATVESEALTIEEIAAKAGIEVTPQLKRRVGWLTDKDHLLVRTTTGSGKGKGKVERYQQVS